MRVQGPGCQVNPDEVPMRISREKGVQCAARGPESRLIRPCSRNYGEVEPAIGVLMRQRPLVDCFQGDAAILQYREVQRPYARHLRQFLSLAFREPAGTDGVDAHPDRY
jgi:hypothetical protein